MTPTQRSLKLLRDRGWIAEKVERPWNPYTKRTQDLFDFGDILCFNSEMTMIVQTTSGSNVASRLTKIKASRIAKLWLKSGYRMIVVHGWRKVGPRGKRKMWACREVTV